TGVKGDNYFASRRIRQECAAVIVSNHVGDIVAMIANQSAFLHGTPTPFEMDRGHRSELRRPPLILLARSEQLQFNMSNLVTMFALFESARCGFPQHVEKRRHGGTEAA